MGIDAGFDMVPALSKGAEDAQNWASFLHCVRSFYKDDPKVEVKSYWIEFNAGEHPMLPFEGHKFLRFSSKVSGSIATSTGVWGYIDKVTEMAKMIFGPRVQSWCEAAEQYGFYGWDEVYKVRKTWDKPDELDSNASHLTAAHISSHTDLIEVRQIPGKGRGLIAVCDIAKGARIVCESPLFLIKSMERTKLDKVLGAKLKDLAKEQQRQFLSLHNNFPGKHAFAGIVKTNALPCGCDSTIGGIYPTICLINHSCLPNAHSNWNSEDEVETIHAIQSIKTG
ncbi:hypothetical protein K449DRAFT_344677, partial [Hypoxylon sp. EC38]